MELVREEWRPLREYPHLYEVSSLGRIRGKKSGRILSPWKQAPGKKHRGSYLRVTLTVHGRPVKRTLHVVVCEAFHGPRPSPEHECLHKDGNDMNPTASNLRWGTRAENTADKRAHGTLLRGSRMPNAKLDERKVKTIRRSKKPPGALARALGVDRSTVRNARLGRTWGHV
jgi:hypothetical protein